MHPTIKDVARATGLNISTVSRSLNGQAGVSRSTRERVVEAARRLGYRRNTLASGLITRRTRTLGLILSDVRNPFVAELARGVEDAAHSAGYQVMLCNSDLNPEKELGYIRTLIEKRVDGMLINSVRHGDLPELHGSVPLVFFNRPVRRRDISEVTASNAEGGLQATRHLLELGHTRIVHLTGAAGHVNLAERAQGYVRAMRDAGLDPLPLLRGPQNYQGGYDLCRKLLSNGGKPAPYGPGRRPTAIFAGNDALAIGAMRALREAGLRIPEDISIAGFDDIDIAPLLSPPLTTVYQPKYEMGQAAVEILLRRLRGEDGGVAEHRVLGTRLIVRESTGPK